MADSNSLYYSIENREYNFVSNTTRSINLVPGETIYPLKGFSQIEGQTIVGISIARRSDNSTEQARTKTGRIIFNDKAMLSAFITLKNSNSYNVIEDMPVRNLVRSTYRQAIGSFAQLLMVDFDADKSFICFADATDIKDGEAIEITFYTTGNGQCEAVVAGCTAAV